MEGTDSGLNSIVNTAAKVCSKRPSTTSEKRRNPINSNRLLVVKQPLVTRLLVRHRVGQRQR